jgi:hypothetical protein
MEIRVQQLCHDIVAVASETVGAGAAAMRTQFGLSWRRRFGTATTLLIDLDGTGLKVSELAAAVTLLDRAVGPFEARLAAGHPLASRPAMAVCARLGVEVLKTTRAPNSADHALLRRASTVPSPSYPGPSP